MEAAASVLARLEDDILRFETCQKVGLGLPQKLDVLLQTGAVGNIDLGRRALPRDAGSQAPEESNPMVRRWVNPLNPGSISLRIVIGR